VREVRQFEGHGRGVEEGVGQADHGLRHEPLSGFVARQRRQTGLLAAELQQLVRSVFGALYEQNVLLEGTILKASMVLPGSRCADQVDVEEVAESTVMCLKTAVPAILPGIVFLSGGQSDQDATAHLDAMNRLGNLPWPLSFSYGRAMQQAALAHWAKDPDRNFAKAQSIVFERARANSLAALGQWEG